MEGKRNPYFLLKEMGVCLIWRIVTGPYNFAEGESYLAPAAGGMRHEKGISFLSVACSVAKFRWVQRLGY
jgi:hypothetical protein